MKSHEKQTGTINMELSHSRTLDRLHSSFGKGKSLV